MQGNYNVYQIHVVSMVIVRLLMKHISFVHVVTIIVAQIVKYVSFMLFFKNICLFSLLLILVFNFLLLLLYYYYF